MTVFSKITQMGHEQVLFCSDEDTGLKAIIAIHDTTLGPALGGCRMWDYDSEEEALEDVLRLSKGMTYKAAISGLNLGGGKAVIIGNPKKLKNEAFFRAFGRFVDSLNGRYITAEDVNIRVSDIEAASLETQYVSGVTNKAGGSGDPSPITAWGTFHGIRAAVKFKLGKDSLKGVKVAVQGCGSVGGSLVGYMAHEGAEIYIADLNEKRLQELSEEYGAKIVALNEVHKLDVDVFAPCALGGFINDETIPEIKAPIIAGAANNQLLDEKKHAAELMKRDILIAPDYVINAGGLMNVYQELVGYNREHVMSKATQIYDTLISIFEVSKEKGISPMDSANELAEKRIKSIQNLKGLRNNLNNQLWFNS